MTGDVLLVAGTSMASKMLRVATGSQYSHVALLQWMDNGLWVAEMLPKTGYTFTPASRRVPQMLKQGVVRTGRAQIQDLNSMILAMYAYRDNGDPRTDPSYSYWSALTVWWSQVTGRPTPHKLICSTYVQKMLEAGGVEFDKPADPEDIAKRIEVLVRIYD